MMFDGDPGKGRLTRYHYNRLLVDRHGRYVYVRDMETGDFWSPVWQSVIKTSEFYKCRHGLLYIVIKTKYSSIETEMKIYIPDGKKLTVNGICVDGNFILYDMIKNEKM